MSVIGLILRNELLLVPFAAFGLEADEPGEHAGNEGNAQIDEDAFGNLANGDIDTAPVMPIQLRQHGDEDIGVDGKEEHLEDGVEGHQPRAVFRVAPGEIVPDDHHGDAAGKSDEDQAHHVLVVARREK